MTNDSFHRTAPEYTPLMTWEGVRLLHTFVSAAYYGSLCVCMCVSIRWREIVFICISQITNEIKNPSSCFPAVHISLLLYSNVCEVHRTVSGMWFMLCIGLLLFPFLSFWPWDHPSFLSVVCSKAQSRNLTCSGVLSLADRTSPLHPCWHLLSSSNPPLLLRFGVGSMKSSPCVSSELPLSWPAGPRDLSGTLRMPVLSAPAAVSSPSHSPDANKALLIPKLEISHPFSRSSGSLSL